MALTQLHIELLIEQCLQGNHLAQMEVYNRYYKAMYNTSLRIVKNTGESEDIMQEAFLIAFSKLHTLHNKSEFGSWLKRIVVNQSIIAYRKQVSLIEWNDNQNDEIYEKEYGSYTNLKVENITNAIHAMKENYRVILTLFYVEGYDHEEISEIMQLSYANSRTLLSRARNQLKKQLLKP